MTGNNISAKEIKFVELFLQNNNLTKSYKQVFPEKKYKTEQVYRNNAYLLLKKPAVQEYYNEALEELKIINHMSKFEILTAITEIARDKKLEAYVRLKALDQLAKLHGMYTDNVNISGSVPVVIKDDIDES